MIALLILSVSSIENISFQLGSDLIAEQTYWNFAFYLNTALTSEGSISVSLPTSANFNSFNCRLVISSIDVTCSLQDWTLNFLINQEVSGPN